MVRSQSIDPDGKAVAAIDSTFRNGSLTAVSVLVGFSLSFLTRWAGLPGPWHAFDLAALSAIVLGTACQIAALAGLLSVRSLVRVTHDRTIRVFMIGLAFVCVGVALALAGDLIGFQQHVLGGPA